MCAIQSADHLACKNIWQVSQSCISDSSYGALHTAAVAAVAAATTQVKGTTYF
jgi:hypothetical protein